ncbi:MAG TPA: class I SAM-dependent methyltransferase [Thermoanaerobaculaceae bacterium]|nr:class I SAM-dependent methyltransferase [Thermoanaerobaculaceae bacterium]HRS15199.1 class I SAM-dependent methyltransferase [Thermoanaerobaculaceae bacterium]
MTPVTRQLVDAIPGEVRLEDASCPMGCPRGEDPVVSAHDRINGLPGRFAVVRCSTCGLMRTNPRPTADTIGFYYPDTYPPFLVGAAPEAAPARPLAAWKQAILRLEARFRDHSTSLPPLPPGRMVEVGCAAGWFLDQMASQGWIVQGVEPSPVAAAAARSRGHRVHVGMVEEAPGPLLPCDLVVGWMVLEHLHRPREALQRFRGWVRPDGWLAVSVPDARTPLRRAFGARWYDLHLPAHLYHFTPRTLGALLGASGWKVERMLWQRSIYALVASLGSVLRETGIAPRAGEWLFDYPNRVHRAHHILRWAGYPLAWLRLSGRMTVWARRDDGG